MLVDSHCHLDFPNLQEDLDGVLERAAQAGVETMVTISTRMTTFDKVLSIAEEVPNVFCTVGIHPHHVADEPQVSVQELVDRACHPKVVGIGESGLDYYYEHSPREAQAESFRIHIAAAREAGVPLVVHTRDADEDTAAILADEMAKGRYPGLLHCFSSGAKLAHAAVDLGLYVSFSGILTFKRSEALRAIAAELPCDRLLVETDSPYLAPQPKRGKRNEPAFVAYTAEVLAETRGQSAADMAAITTANFHTLFSKVPRPADA